MAGNSSDPAFSESRPKIAVVTALAGDRDDLKDPEVRFESADYIAFVDDPTKHPSAVWDVRTLPTGWSLDVAYSDRRSARLIKALPDLFLPNYDYSIWVDGNIQLVHEPKRMIEKFIVASNADLSCFPHRDRICPYAELLTVRIARLDHTHNIKHMHSLYRSLDIKRRSGVYETGLLLRKHGTRSMNFGLCWWETMCRSSSRDQLSFPIAVNKTGARVHAITPGHVWRNPYMSMSIHANHTGLDSTIWSRLCRYLTRKCINVFHPEIHYLRDK